MVKNTISATHIINNQSHWELVFNSIWYWCEKKQVSYYNGIHNSRLDHATNINCKNPYYAKPTKW